MYKFSLIYNDKVWKAMEYLFTIQRPISFNDFLDLHGISENEFENGKDFLGQFGVEVSTENEGNDKKVLPLKGTLDFQVNLNLLEWLSLQAHFPLLLSYSHKSFHKTLVAKLGELEEKHPSTDLFKYLDTEKKIKSYCKKVDDDLKEKITLVNSTIKEKRQLSLSFNNRIINMNPYRLVYLEGGLSIVGEELGDNCLVYIKLDQVEDLKVHEFEKSHSKFSAVEVNDFIQAIRAINGNEERLVLKVNDQSEIDLCPDYHFLGNPYITANAEGDLIWAAHVEVTNELYDWLYEIKDSVEILDPVKLLKEFKNFCRDKESTFKKAS